MTGFLCMNLETLNQIIGTTKIIKTIQKVPNFHDDPQLHKYVCTIHTSGWRGDGRLPDPLSAGVSLNPSMALKKAVFESLERYSLASFKFSDFVFTSYVKLFKKHQVLSPKLFCYFNKFQLASEQYQGFSYSDTDSFFWSQATDLNTGADVHIPAQLLFTPYRYKKNEKTINFPISTGSALGEDLDDAVYRGICEVVERDAFITSHLFKLQPQQIVFDSTTSLVQSYLDTFSKYRVKTASYLLQSDLKIPTVMTIFFGDHWTTPAVSVGLKTDLNLERAIVGSMDEAFQLRSWIRRCLISKNFTGKNYTERLLLHRAAFWSNSDNQHYLNFFIKNDTKIRLTQETLSKNSRLNSGKKLDLVKNILFGQGHSIYFKNVTHPSIGKFGLTVVKVLIPALHPLFLDDYFPYLGGNRFEKLRQNSGHSINVVPHPFL